MKSTLSHTEVTMVIQKELFDEVELTGLAQKKLLEMIQEGLAREEVGFKGFCFEIGKGTEHGYNQVRDALNGNGKYFSVTWLVEVFRVCPDLTRELLFFFCDLARYERPAPRQEKSLEDELHELRRFKARVLRMVGGFRGD